MTHEQTTNDPHVTLLDGADDGFSVASRTRPALTHTVHVLEGTCSCEAGQRGIDCWHLDFCRAVYYWRRYDQRQQLWAARAARLAARQKKVQAA